MSSATTKKHDYNFNGGYCEQINKQENGAGAVGYVLFNNNTYSSSIVVNGGTFKIHPLAGWIWR